MTRLRSGLVPMLVAGLFILAAPVYGQVRQQRPAGQARPTMPTLALIVGGNYFNPPYTNVDDVYSTIEHNYALPAGSAFKSFYNVLVAVRLSPVDGQSVQAEGSGTVLKMVKDNTTNYLQLYYLGGSYLIHFVTPVVAPYIGAGAGYEWLNTERAYATRIGVARVNSQLAQIHGIIGVEYFTAQGVSVGLEAQYAYATSVAPRRADLDFTLKGITGGLRIGVPLTAME